MRRSDWVRVTVVLALAAGGVWALVGAAAPTGDPPKTAASDAALLHEAEYALIRACMEAQGFRVWTPPLEPVPDDRAFPYVVDDTAWAREHGYGSDLAARRGEVQAADANLRYFRRLAPLRRAAALDALHGPRAGDGSGLRAELPGGGVVGASDRGCTADARRQLYRDLAAWFRADRVVASLAAERQARVLDDPRWSQALPAWAVCMQAAGHPFATPDAARAAALQDHSAGAHEREVRRAVAEATCAERSGLAATARALDAGHGAALRAEHRSEVAIRERLLQAAVPRARTVLAASGGRSQPPGP